LMLDCRSKACTTGSENTRSVDTYTVTVVGDADVCCGDVEPPQFRHMT
jgi:hypothetical protein